MDTMLETLIKGARYYAIAGTVCFLLSLEMNLMIFFRYLNFNFAGAYFFSLTGVAIGVYLLLLGRGSSIARNHGLIVVLLNVFAFVALFMAMPI